MPVESGLGVQTVLGTGASKDHPSSYAETPGGLLLMANGIDPVSLWDGYAATIVPAGLAPPTSAIQLGGIGLGYITGNLVAYQRFVDARGNVSDLSPVSNLMNAGTDGLIHAIDYSRTTGVVTITSLGHGLTTGETVLIDAVEGVPLVNGARTITVIDADTFTLNNFVLTGGFYTQGGYWTVGAQTVAYGAVPIPTNPKVVRRQILRNLAGNMDVLYVDIDTTDLKSTAFLSGNTDSVLASNEPVSLTYGDDNLPYASRHGVPPAHKGVIVSHKGRIFATADATYSAGHCKPTFNSTRVVGVATNWKSSFVGRLLYTSKSTTPYSIAAVDEANQVITLATPYLDPPVPYTAYVIRPEPGERRLVYFSEPGLPESWPVWNAFAVPENNDTIVGMVSLGQYLYIIERRHIHRFTFQIDPSDGFVFLSVNRGSLNNRTYAIADNNLYMLDEIGIHKFDGDDSQSISLSIQNIFQEDGLNDVQVDWTADQTLWHAAHDPVRDTIRWFVTMVGYNAPFHAICHNYRNDRWWIEQYPTAMTASANATLGARRSLAGTDARRVVCLGQGAYDGVAGVGTLRGTVTAASTITITDATASFDALEGAPVAIVAGTGSGQQRIIASNTPTQLQVVQPWTTVPDTTSVYQVGGIPWIWRSGWFRYVDDESENPSDVDVVFRPLVNPATMVLQLYFDHSTTPRSWTRSLTQDGVTLASGQPQITINLDAPIGWARQRFSRHASAYSYADRFVQVELSGVQGGEPVRVSQIVIDGVETS